MSLDESKITYSINKVACTTFFFLTKYRLQFITSDIHQEKEILADKPYIGINDRCKNIQCDIQSVTFLSHDNIKDEIEDISILLDRVTDSMRTGGMHTINV